MAIIKRKITSVGEDMEKLEHIAGENGHPFLVPDFKGNAFNFSPLRMMFAVGLSYTALIMFLLCLLSGVL